MNDTFGRRLGIFSAPERAGKMISRATPRRHERRAMAESQKWRNILQKND
jgi:hypothetical protein